MSLMDPCASTCLSVLRSNRWTSLMLIRKVVLRQRQRCETSKAERSAYTCSGAPARPAWTWHGSSEKTGVGKSSNPAKRGKKKENERRRRSRARLR